MSDKAEGPVFFQIEFVEEHFERRLCRHGHRVQRESPAMQLVVYYSVQVDVLFDRCFRVVDRIVQTLHEGHIEERGSNSS
jgi:hypothetical protein